VRPVEFKWLNQEVTCWQPWNQDPAGLGSPVAPRPLVFLHSCTHSFIHHTNAWYIRHMLCQAGSRGETDMAQPLDTHGLPDSST
jgi:hypothetical protein